MGQYQKHLYGSTLYGKLNVFYGQYITEAFDAQEKFTGKINHTITSVLPFATYKPDTYETTLGGSWTVNASKQAIADEVGDVFRFKASGSSFEVFYRTQQGGPQTLHLELQKEDGTIVHQADVNTYSLSAISTKSYKFPMVSYNMYDSYVIVGTIPTGATHKFTLDSFKVLTANVDVEVRGSVDNTTWTAWEKVPSTLTQVGTTTTWSVSGASAITYSNIRYAQARLTLVTSDELTPPNVQRVVLQSGNSNLRTQNGLWTGTFDMKKVAAAKSVTFKKTLFIKWKSVVPENTTMTMRSSSSYTGEANTFGAITAPYKQNTSRLRLKQGATAHSVLIGPINPVKTADANDPKKYWSIKGWTEWTDNSFLPKDGSGVNVSYIFSKTGVNVESDENVLQTVKQPMLAKEDGTGNKFTFNPQPFYLTVKMDIPDGKGTPVVDLIDLYCEINYKEAIPVNTKTASFIDNQMTGRSKLQTINQTVFHPPLTTGEGVYNVGTINGSSLLYGLEDKTSRPNDVQIFYLTKETDTVNPRVTTSNQEQVYVKVFSRAPGGNKGVPLHYQYNGGSVRYLKPISEEMSSQFTPSLTKDVKYKYYILNGWTDNKHTVMKGETLEDIAGIHTTTVAAINAEMTRKKYKIQYDAKGALLANQTIYIPTTPPNTAVTMLFSGGTAYTNKSSHNSRIDKLVDLSSDIILVSVPTSPSNRYTDWVSEEKIYNGVINHEDIRGAYIRTQINNSSVASFERNYKVLSNDTWATIAKKFNVDLKDLMVRNEDVVIGTGKIVIIPPNILLPRIAQGVEFDTSNPFEVTIVDNSVYKTDGAPLDKSVIPINWSGKNLPMVAKYKNSTPVTVDIKRGDLNGRDPLQHYNVLSISAVKKKNGMKFVPYNETAGTGDYKLVDDYIDWSPAQDLSSEPAKDEVYSVTYIYQEVDSITVQLDTTYIEETGVDLVWRSTDTKVLSGICSPGHDSLVALPEMNTFAGYGEKGLKDYSYIIEDNDLWVETSVSSYNGKPHVLGTLKNRNPKENWFPLITPGFYYLKEDEFYMYSETLETPLEVKEIPIAKNISYEATEKDMGIKLQPKRDNLITNSTFNTKSWKTAGTFNFKTLDVSAPLDISNLTSPSQGYDSATLSWTKSITTDVVRYEVSVWNTVIEDYTILTSNVTGATYTAKNLEDNTLYTFKVVAIDEAANASQGITLTVNTKIAPDKIPPYDVTTLVASDITATTLVLNWVPSASGDAEVYNVYKGSTLIGSPTSPTILVGSLTTNTSYKFTVKAKDIAGNLSQGTSITVSTL